MGKRKKEDKKIRIESYIHKDKKRVNNPQVGLVSGKTDPSNKSVTKYAHDPHIDPYLSWAGKKEGNELEVPNVSLHIHERIDPKRIAKSFLKKQEQISDIPHQVSLFEEPDNEPPLYKAIDFYRYEQDWANRLIAGDSLLVMNSLLNKEGMAGKFQMIYIDPPYGIKYNSNFQPFTNKRNVKDNNDADIPAEPEMIKAFRDTWELGIHSYLTYLRDRLLLAKEMLNETGSCFVQISDDNVHHIKELMEEVFGNKNFIALIPFTKTTSATTNLLSSVNDYLVWFSKDKKEVKYRQLYFKKTIGGAGGSQYKKVELEDGTIISAKEYEENKLSNGKYFYVDNLQSQSPGSKYEVSVEGRTFYPTGYWKTSEEGMMKLIEARRIAVQGNSIGYKRYFDDFPVYAMNNFWGDTGGAGNKIYVVQTSDEVIKRCLLMTTDPGDLVFDPTCGSGTTAYIAEQWGRRWITCDTSRVAVALAKQRLMTANFDYYELAYPDEGVRSGFNYKKVPHITLGSIANNEPPKEEVLYDQPKTIKGIVRVTGPFTVEAVPSVNVKPLVEAGLTEASNTQIGRVGETAEQAVWRDELKTTGIRAVGGTFIEFSRLEPTKGLSYLQAEGEILKDNNETKIAYICFGPKHGSIEQRYVEQALKEARSLRDRPDFVIFAGFHFDPEAAKDIDHIEWAGVKILKAQMSVDLLTDDLRKKRSSNQSYWLVGQPDVEVKKLSSNTYQVKVLGFDYYDPVSGKTESKGSKHIAMWFLDTDYDERSLFPDQVFFPHGDRKQDWTKLTKTLNGEVDEGLIDEFKGTVSLPFKIGEEGKIAVKIIDTRGIESLVVKSLE